jgi:molecular chaperone GrpE
MKTHPQTTPPAVAVTVAESAPTLRLVSELREAHAQLAADFDAFRRRSHLETERRAAAQKEAFIRALLPTLDNLERALGSGAAPDSRSLHHGVEMTLQQLRRLLAQHGIETPEDAGERFDPGRHEAIGQRTDPSRAPEVILEVVQRGYRHGGRVLRAAQVIVNDFTPPPTGSHAR